jgi:hypothetical protein
MILEAALIAAHLIAPAKVEAPKPKAAIEVPHKFYDRTAKVELAAALSLDAWDNAQTCQHVFNDGKPELVVIEAPRPGYSGNWYWKQGRETGLPVQSCGGVTALLAAQLAGQELLAYVLHRTNHHQIERFARFISIEGNAQGIISSAAHRNSLEPSLHLPYGAKP